MKKVDVKNWFLKACVSVSMLPLYANANDPSKLLPDEIKDKNAVDIMGWVMENVGTLVAAFIIIVALIVGGNNLLDGLKDYNKDRDIKKLMGHLVAVIIVVVAALLMGYAADSYISSRFGGSTTSV